MFVSSWNHIVNLNQSLLFQTDLTSDEELSTTIDLSDAQVTISSEISFINISSELYKHTDFTVLILKIILLINAQLQFLGDQKTAGWTGKHVHRGRLSCLFVFVFQVSFVENQFCLSLSSVFTSCLTFQKLIYFFTLWFVKESFFQVLKLLGLRKFGRPGPERPGDVKGGIARRKMWVSAWNGAKTLYGCKYVVQNWRLKRLNCLKDVKGGIARRKMWVSAWNSANTLYVCKIFFIQKGGIARRKMWVWMSWIFALLWNDA